MTDLNLDQAEAEMREALGLRPAPQKAAKTTAQASRPFPHTIVELSVRKDGGKPFRFTHRSRSISRLTAQLEAEKAARKKGYEVWVLLDVRQCSG